MTKMQMVNTISIIINWTNLTKKVEILNFKQGPISGCDAAFGAILFYWLWFPYIFYLLDLLVCGYFYGIFYQLLYTRVYKTAGSE